MSSNDHNSSEAGTDANIKMDDANGRVIKREDPELTKPSLSLNRKLKVSGILILLIAIIGLVGTATYPFWRSKALITLDFFNVNIEALAHAIGVPQTTADRGRGSERINDRDPPPVAPSEQTSGMKTKEQTPDATNAIIKADTKPVTGYGTAKKTSQQNASREVKAPHDKPDNKQKLQTKTEPLAYRMREVEDWVSRLEGQLTRMNAKITKLETTSRRGTFSSVGEPSGQVVELSERVTALDSAVAEMRARTDEQKPKSAPEVLISSMVRLAERVTAIEAQAQADNDSIGAIRNETSAVGSRLSALTEQVTMLDTLIERGNPAREQAALLLLSVNQLAIVAARGDSFVSQLKSIRTIAHGAIDLDDAIGRLVPHAAKGAATLVTLRSQFATVAMAAVRTRDAGTPDSWVGKTLSRVASLVSIRKIEAPEPGSVDDALAAADAALASGDLSAALSALRGFDGDIGATVEPWLRRASDRLAINKSIADLQAAALAALSAAG